MDAAAARVGALQVLTPCGGESEDSADGQILGWMRARDGSVSREDFHAAFARGMLGIGYNGYTGYELCHILPKVNGEAAGIEFVDRNARLAVQHMRRVIQAAEAAVTTAARAV
jgi:hypothetical protein